MKFNLEIEINGLYEDYSLDEEFKYQLTNQLKGIVIKTIAKEKLDEIKIDTEVKKVIHELKKEIETFKKEQTDYSSQVKELVEEEFNKLIGEKVLVSKDYFGTVKEEKTIREVILDQIESNAKDFENLISRKIHSLVQDKLRRSDFALKNQVEALVKEHNKDHAEKVVKTLLGGKI